jgi:hypothetical protein
MALALADRVRETSTTTGTGTFTLSGAVSGYQSFSVVGNGNTTYYCIASQSASEWEVGVGTWSTGNTLARTTVLASSAGGAAVNFSAGTKDVFVTYPAGYTTNATNNPGTSGQALVSNGTGVAPSWQTISTVIGATTQVAYNNAGTMAGSANLTFDGTNLTCGGNITSNSDETLKTNWRDLPADFVEQLAKVKHGTYDRLDQPLTQDGVSAQSLQGLLPNSVLADEDGKLAVAYGNAALVAAIKLAERVVQLEALVAKLAEGK